MLAGARLESTSELKLYSEAWFVADARDLGPYSFINAIPRHGPGGMYAFKPAVVLRVSDYVPYIPTDLSRTSDDDYHAGWLSEEMAALFGLLLDVRVMPGPIERTIDPNGDPFGSPRAHSTDILPALPHSVRNPQIPLLHGTRNLEDLRRLESYPSLSLACARTLIKGSRLYQQGLAIADSSPHLAWLLFVAAVEAVAVHWDKDQHTPVERLERSFPDLVAMVRASDVNLLVGVADQLNGLTAATSKFIAFVVEFAPDPPAKRSDYGRFDYERRSLRDAMSKIYGYRSRALHGGKPFPDSMCWPPDSDLDRIPEEIPSGLAAGSFGASWRAEDTPMFLHTFARIARGAILNWWASVVPMES